MIHKSVIFVSLTLAGMTLTIWIMGHNGYVRIYDTGWNATRTHVCCLYGGFEFEHERAGTPHPCSSPDLAPSWIWRLSSQFGTRIRFPVWVPLILFLTYPALASICRPLQTRRRRKRNRCVKCGYDLTGLPEPRCPECGATLVPSNCEAA